MWTDRLKTTLLAGLVLVSLLAGGVRAGTLPDYYPEKFERYGPIDDINLKKRTIIVDDVYMLMVNPLPVHTLTTRFSTPSQLRKGQIVGYTSYRDASHRRYITEIWVLPKGYKNPEERD